MNFLEPLKINDIDFNKIIYPKCKKNNKKKIILIKYNNKSTNFVFQTPTLININNTEFKNGYAEIELILQGKDDTKINNFINFLNKIDDKVKLDAQKNVATWFNIDENVETEINYQRIIRSSEKYKNGTLKIKLLKNNDFETKLQLNNSNDINIEQIPNNSWCKMILEFYAVWVNSNNDFGIFLRPILVSFILKDNMYNYNFVEDSDDEFDIPETETNNDISLMISAMITQKELLQQAIEESVQ